VDFRYPGGAADREEASEALEIATRLHASLRSLLEIAG